ncbi:MAG TPA: hypothetical protein VFN49_11975, partial [Candidatus Aquilonibacter sp.]|nr:hypothetical protein [Candidatus Aquilonibacter sp.]
TDGAATFSSIFDAGNSTSIGAFAVAPSDSKTLYVGTGEGFPRNTAALGDGVFVSHDAGATWHAIGLAATQHIAKIAVDPHDPNTVIVAAMGPEFTPGGERGIYRTNDGGKSWTRTLYVNPTTGGADVSFDPSDPSIVYAGTFDYVRRPWTFRGGGPGSGLWKSNDGGRTWKRLTDPALHNGLPGGTINRVGVAICAHHPEVVYAIVPTAAGVLYRSQDGGASWKLVNASKDLVFRPFYFSQVRVNPDDPNDVWIVSGGLERSKNGGKTFKGVNAGGDNHDLWIDPRDTARMLLGSDQGFNMTVDDAKTWDYVNTVPMGQVYRVGYDRDVPYHIMGGFQDNQAWWGPNSSWNDTGVTSGEWRMVATWGDGQYVQPDPRNDKILYLDTHFGDIARRDLRDGALRNIAPQPIIGFGTGVGSLPYRFNWSAPILVSKQSPGTVYFGGNVLFRTRDGGASWDTISPQLTQPCPSSYLGRSGGPITHDNTNAEAYCTIYAIAESASSLWVGTDNGHVAYSKDGGSSWTDVSDKFPGLPAQSWVQSIEASQADASVVYVTFDRHRFGDTRPYVYVTHDGGASWSKIDNGLRYWAYVVREDPRAPTLLFAGCEDGTYVSFDGGAHWRDLRLNMVHLPVYDLQIQPDFNDLIAGTHGRGFVILDDITPLESLARATQSQVALFRPGVAWRYMPRPFRYIGRSEFVSDNKPYGAVISYYLKPPAASKHASKKKAKEKVTLDILDGARVIKELQATADPGVNRVVWDLSTDAPGGRNAKQDPRPYYVFYSLHIEGPQVLPGRYTARLRARGQTLTTTVEVRLDPKVTAPFADLRAQYDAIARLAALQERGETWMSTIDADRKKLAKRDPKLVARLSAQEDRLRNGNGSQNAGYQQPAQVVDQLAYLRTLLGGAYAGPTQAQADAIDRYANELERIGKVLVPMLARAATELPAKTPAPRHSPR